MQADQLNVIKMSTQMFSYVFCSTTFIIFRQKRLIELSARISRGMERQIAGMRQARAVRLNSLPTNGTEYVVARRDDLLLIALSGKEISSGIFPFDVLNASIFLNRDARIQWHILRLCGTISEAGFN